VETRKQRILETLDGFVNQRPGMEAREYGDDREAWKLYRAASREVTKDMHDYYAIRGQIAWRDSIDADALVKSFSRAFSGRLSITEDGDKVTLSYCAGQYMPTEYRKAACAVLANAWWSATREGCPVKYDPEASSDASPGAWMRNQAKQTFGIGIQRGYFN
jgi:hypothetical protein